MDVLSLLEEVQNESLILRHPLAGEDISLGYAYAVGVGLVAVAEGELSAKRQEGIEKLAAGLSLPEPQICKLLEVVLAPDKSVVKGVVETVNQLSWQYLFLLDAQRLASNHGEFSPKSQQALDAFMAMFKLSLDQKKVWYQLAEGVLSDDFARNVNAFALVYGEDLKRIYRSAVYYLPEQGKDALEKIEREIDGAKESIATELERLENCPSLKEYREDSAGAGRNQNSWRGVGSVANWKQDNFAGKTWDEDRVQIQQKHSRNIDVLEKKRQALAAALDSMYLSS
ncbi:MAG: hypothetical protein VB133_14940 [Anaeromusa sp.]|uniref:hypothetical protein n=1 Tax=Anaeromusa sp. TaxID=1872520 RepID=UPI002B2206B0|nr:hypothetical protein [Anaeromusa sp.]MEA4836415.1 hypothetical protein [Anaeromusa sp.]